MSLKDIKSFVFEGHTEVVGQSAEISLTVSATPVAAVNISGTPATTNVVQVQVPGAQGPPGLQNVFVQSTDPSKDGSGNTIWGSAETNYIWIQV